MSNASHVSPPAPSDPRLKRLLEVERGLEARLRQADQDARSRRDALEHELQRHEAERLATLETAAHQQEQEDLDAHARQLAQLAAESAARVAALQAVSSERLDALARRAVRAALGLPEERPEQP